MNAHPSLFDTRASQGAHRATDPATSVVAARSIGGQPIRDQQLRVLWAMFVVREPDATAHDIVLRLAYTGRAPQQSCVAKRLGELRDLGYVESTGTTRPGGTGRPLQVHRVTDTGVSVVRAAIVEGRCG